MLPNYKPKKINSDILLFKASISNEEYSDVEDSANHWKELTFGTTNVIKIQGNHNSIMASPIVSIIANIQDAALFQLNKL